MDSKEEISIGDYVMYTDTMRIVTDEDGNPLKVIGFISEMFLPAIRYENGEFDWTENIMKAPSLLLELI